MKEQNQNENQDASVLELPQRGLANTLLNPSETRQELPSTKDGKRNYTAAIEKFPDIITAYLAGHPVGQIALSLNLTIPAVNGMLRRFRTEQYEENEVTKKVMAADSIGRLKHMLTVLWTELNEATTTRLRLSVMSEIRRVNHDIAEIQGLTKGTSIVNIQEAKLYDFKPDNFPPPLQTQTKIHPIIDGETQEVPAPNLNMPDHRRVAYDDQELIDLPNGSSVARSEITDN